MDEMQKRQAYAMIPKKLASEYGLTVAGVYAMLLDECVPPNYEVHITKSKLAKKCGMSSRNLRYTLLKLEELKLIMPIKIIRGGNIYKVVPIVNARIYTENPEPVPEPLPVMNPEVVKLNDMLDKYLDWMYPDGTKLSVQNCVDNLIENGLDTADIYSNVFTLKLVIKDLDEETLKKYNKFMSAMGSYSSQIADELMKRFKI